MAKKTSGGKNELAHPSVDDVKPVEEGGPIARSGFNYQDEIAVGFLIEMLENPLLLKVHCESHDDVLLVRWVDGSAMRLAEFVQVKASEPDKLWSVADLCAPKKGVGTSIFEISFARDMYQEESRFRLVTLRPVVSELEMLTFPRGAPGREIDGDRFKTLQSELDKRFPGLKSPKSNGLDYWIKSCFWDVRHSEDAVRKDNLLRLIRIGDEEGKPLLPEHAEVLLGELRDKVKTASRLKWEPDRDKKIITREALYEWWKRRTREIIEGAAATTGGKLREKMIEAGLPTELVELAVDMRRSFASIARTSQYMESAEEDRLQNRVKSEVMSLRARFVAGRLDLDGVGFHALCLERMDAVNNERPDGSEDHSAYLKGCMYDITDRCFLRFARPVQ